MDRINAFLGNFRERLNNPLIFSFLISWAVINWRIVIVLFWDRPLGQAGKDLSLVNYIETNLDSCSAFWYPFASAILYTLLSPPIKNLVVAFQNINFKWGESMNISILKGGKVSIDKYFSLKENYENRKKNLELMIDSEESNLKRAQSLEDELVKQRARNEEILNQISGVNSVIDNLNRVDVISGKWVCKVVGALGSTEEEIEISGNMMYLIKGNSREQKFMISNFVYRVDQKRIQFCLYKTNGDGLLYSFNDLEVLPGSMAGNEYTHSSRSEIKYSRSTDVLKRV